jgi:mRNA interferase RelE/StbE
LIEARDMLDDIAVFDRAMAAGPVEGLPHALVKRLVGGEPALKVYREWRGLTQSGLARRADVNRVQIVEIEAGRATGSVTTLRRLADTLDVTLDELA